ncbi:hypothetical protein D9757_007867 [Collybiopsis confluens]|uniref:Uncharacterized protein n=1 Tax=Collybiopsis confluens TaxID=2823264 RepID=A0A8H5HD85_9AGAR|nr:hypothetical protein D9757_007867 [Collybiopsis confluens]
MKFILTASFISMIFMVILPNGVMAKSEGVAYSTNGCSGVNTGTLHFGDAFCTPIPGGPWDSIEFYTDGATECFYTFTNSNCDSSGFVEVFQTFGSGCFGGLGGTIHSMQKKEC